MSAGAGCSLPRFRWADGFLLLFFLLLSLGFLLFGLSLRGEEGLQAEIISAGESLGIYPLDQEAEILVEQGRYSNLVCFGQGEVFIREADCPDQYCVKHVAIRHRGESIVCLPARLVVEICGEEEGGLDAVSK
ncbi:MAG: NusG domain II-containing protein [Bacillota bacterium]|nr:NusG domain II-containing protein [Bacillota bacterium]